MADTDPAQAPSQKEFRKLLEHCRVDMASASSWTECETRVELPGMADSAGAKAALQAGVERLAKLQEKLYPQRRWAVLIVFQAMDAGGKDGTIKHVMSGVNPQGVHVTSFKPPGPEELAHDFLWRVSKALPARGMIGIFNRSHYEEVLVPRVKPELLEAQHLPAEVVGGKHFWEHRLESIAEFERHLARQGTVILKFFLNISKDEQRLRLLARLEDKSKTLEVQPRATWTTGSGGAISCTPTRPSIAGDGDQACALVRDPGRSTSRWRGCWSWRRSANDGGARPAPAQANRKARGADRRGAAAAGRGLGCERSKGSS